jgi:hypothetical protein
VLGGPPVPDCPAGALVPAWPDTPPVPWVPPSPSWEGGVLVDEHAVPKATNAITVERRRVDMNITVATGPELLGNRLAASDFSWVRMRA